MSCRLPHSTLLVLCAFALWCVQSSAQQPAPKKPAQKPATKPAATAPKTPATNPVVVFDTAKGTFEIEFFPDDAPRSVEHILRLVNRNFYNGQRVHRVEPGFVVQFGDPKTRDMTKRDLWGQTAGGGSGKSVGVAEISKKHLHVKGAVGMAHAGDPKEADSQIYVLLGNRPALDGKYAVIGQVVSGMDVVQKLQVEDRIKKASLKK
jgi:cyclophilin family peptidyl-prolyl cis-trans isomerase